MQTIGFTDDIEHAIKMIYYCVLSLVIIHIYKMFAKKW